MSDPSQNAPVRIRHWLLFALSVAILGAVIWGIRWAYYTRVPLPEAVQALEETWERVYTQLAALRKGNR